MYSPLKCLYLSIILKIKQTKTKTLFWLSFVCPLLQSIYLTCVRIAGSTKLKSWISQSETTKKLINSKKICWPREVVPRGGHHPLGCRVYNRECTRLLNYTNLEKCINLFFKKDKWKEENTFGAIFYMFFSVFSITVD